MVIPVNHIFVHVLRNKASTINITLPCIKNYYNSWITPNSSNYFHPWQTNDLSSNSRIISIGELCKFLVRCLQNCKPGKPCPHSEYLCSKDIIKNHKKSLVLLTGSILSAHRVPWNIKEYNILYILNNQQYMKIEQKND